MPPVVQHRRGTLASLTAANETPNAGEIYFETDTNKLKVGDGVTPYNSLPYVVGGAGTASGGGSALNRTLSALTFNGSTTTFNLTIGSTTVTPATAASLLILLNGVVQQPDVSYTVSGSQITFSVAPAATDTFFGVHLAGAAATFWSPTQITADQNNYALSIGATHVRLATDAARSITGFVAEAGASATLHNVGAHTITLAHQSSSSTAANRILSATGSDLTIQPNEMVTVTYDSTTARWRASPTGRQAAATWWATTADKTKLDGIATGATANATDAQLRDRTTHTGQQAISTVTGLQAALDGKQAAGSYAAAVHAHTIANVTGLQAELDAKQPSGSYAASVHGHVISDVSGLQAALDGKQASGSYASATHTHAISSVTGLQAALDGKQPTGVYATLVDGKVPASQLPSFVDDVIEVDNTSLLPTSGEEGKIYIAINSGKTYRWAGTQYVEIVASPGSTDVIAEGSTNLYFTNARAISAVQSSLDGKAAAVHTHTSTDITDFATAVAAVSPPSPDEVVEYLAPANFPATGNSSLLYIATDTSRAYRWTGTEYVEVGPSTVFTANHASTHNPGGADAVSLIQTEVFTRSSAPASATTISAGRYDWTVPSGAKSVAIEVIGAGGGGGSGRRGAAGAVRTGGSGGGGGSRSLTTLAASDLLTSVLSVYVGRGGVGGAAVTADDTNGNAGESNSQNGTSWVRYNQNVYSTTSAIAQAGGGGAGGGGTAANVNGGLSWAGTFPGGAGGSASTTGGSTAPEVAASSSGGGGGGAVYANGSSSNGGSGGRISMFSATAFGGGGGAAGTTGAAGGDAPAITLLVAGQGGGGGAAGSGGNGGNGGNGAFPGGGGGGGGACPNGFASGAGGNGADGIVRITVWY